MSSVAAIKQVAPADPGRATEIRLIHIAKAELQRLGKLDEDSYRDLVARFGNGAASSKDLSAAQRKRLLDHFKACGFQLRAKAGKTGAGWRREPQMRKLRALWYGLADGGHVQKPADGQACDAAITSWAKRQLPELDALRFANGAQMNKLIEELKAWCRRVGVLVRD